MQGVDTDKTQQCQTQRRPLTHLQIQQLAVSPQMAGLWRLASLFEQVQQPLTISHCLRRQLKLGKLMGLHLTHSSGHTRHGTK